MRKLLSTLADFVQLNAGKQLVIYEEVDHLTSQLVHLMNASCTAALVAMHNSMKKEMFDYINTSIDRSGLAIIESFKSSTLESLNKQKEKQPHGKPNISTNPGTGTYTVKPS